MGCAENADGTITRSAFNAGKTVESFSGVFRRAKTKLPSRLTEPAYCEIDQSNAHRGGRDNACDGLQLVVVEAGVGIGDGGVSSGVLHDVSVEQ
jgi:hypothetical protein